MNKIFLILSTFLFVSGVRGQTWQWGRSIPSTLGSGVIEGYAVATDRAGNVFMGGFNEDYSITFGSYTFHSSETIVAKYDSLGNFLWAIGTDSGVHTVLATNGLATDLSGNLYVLGMYGGHSIKFGNTTLPNPASGLSYFLVKYSSSGSPLWAKSFSCSSAGGSPAFNVAGAVTCDNTANVYITGAFVGPTIAIGSFTLYNYGSSDIFTAKCDPNGNVIWAERAGGGSLDVPTGISVSISGQVYVTGIFTSSSISFGTSTIYDPPGDNNVFLFKYDASGNPIWAKAAMPSIVTNGGVKSWWGNVVTDSKDNSYITGTFNGDSIRFDSYKLSRTIPTINTTLNTALFITKYDSSGNVLWAKLGETGELASSSLNLKSCGGYSVAIDPFNNAWLCGFFSDSLIFDGNIIHHPDGSEDPIFIASLSSAGGLGSICLKSGGDDYAGIACDHFGNLFVVGDYYVDTFILGPDTLLNPYPNPYPYKGELIFVAKLHYLDSIPCDGNSVSILTHDTTICKGASFTIKVGGQDSLVYKWSPENGLNNPNIKEPVTQPDSNITYTLTANNVSNCPDSGRKTISVNVINVTQNLRDTLLCRDQPIQFVLNANVPAGAAALWSNNSTMPTITITDTGKYWVRVSECSCWESDTMHVTTDFCDCKVFFPNAFTPNNDGKNDIIHVKVEEDCILSDFVFSIYNRWGQLVFKTYDIQKGWDGVFKAEKAEIGAYFYYLEYTAGIKHKKHMLKGDLTLIR